MIVVIAENESSFNCFCDIFRYNSSRSDLIWIPNNKGVDIDVTTIFVTKIFVWASFVDEALQTFIQEVSDVYNAPVYAVSTLELVSRRIH